MSREDRKLEEKAILVRDDDCGSRLVPGGIIVEGDVEDEAAPATPTSP